VRWESGIDDVAFVGPVVHESTVVVATRAGGVHGVALDSGERRWRESAPGDVWAPLVHDEDRASVYVADTAEPSQRSTRPAESSAGSVRSTRASAPSRWLARTCSWEPRTAAYGPSGRPTARHSGRSPRHASRRSRRPRGHRGRLRPLRRRVAPGGGERARRHAVLRDREPRLGVWLEPDGEGRTASSTTGSTRPSAAAGRWATSTPTPSSGRFIRAPSRLRQ